MTDDRREQRVAEIDLDLFNRASAKAGQGGMELLSDDELLALCNGYAFLSN